jgi:hypothetical protein
MNVFDNVFYYETDKGNVGIVRADNEADARERVENYYYEDITTITCCSDIEKHDYGVAPLFGDAPVLRTKNGYEYEININPEDMNTKDKDIWGAAMLWLDDERGVDFNLSYDDGLNQSAIYKASCDKYMEDLTETFSHYEIDFSDIFWKQKLIDEMERVAEEFWGKETNT